MRRRAEDDDVELDDGERELVAKLRALPPEGEEPDWKKLEAAIRAEVGDRAPTPWWRNWKWLVPISALAATAAVALVIARDHRELPPAPTLTTTTHEQHHDSEPAPVTPTTTDAPAMWLDGEAVEIDNVDDTSLDSLDQAARDALDTDDVVGSEDLEDLDDAGLDQLEHWLEKNKS